MNYIEAHKAIEEILSSIEDKYLPEFSQVETDKDGMPVVWWASTGHHLGHATRNGVREPLIYRSDAATDAIHKEMICRADRILLENGDNPVGIDFKNLRRRATPQVGDLRDGAIEVEGITA
jgi:hypothetical protein